jgi:bifunctional non-homologous end joining protein LigD
VPPTSITKYKYGTTGRKVDNFIQPMLATAIDKPFSDKDWVFELKLDGFRAVAETGSKQLRFYSRNGLSFVDRFPLISDALLKVKRKLILDGEVVLFNENGLPDFQKLQHYEENKHLPIVYYVFDLLEMDGENICSKGLFSIAEK